MSGYKFYMSRYINNSWGQEVSLEDYFDGLKYSKCDGLSAFGKPKNIYTESYAEEEELRVYIPKTVVRENTDIEFEFVFNGENRRSVYNDFVDWITGYKLKYRDTCRKKEVQMILVEAIEPSDDFLYGSDPYILASFKFKNLSGSSVDNSSTEPDVCPTLEELTIDATAVSSDIASGKTAYARGMKLVGNMSPIKIDVESNGIRLATSTFESIPDVFDFSNLIYADNMLVNCINLKTIENLDLHNAESADSMCANCSDLQNVTNCNFQSLKIARAMFSFCGKLVNINGSTFESLTNTELMFTDCPLLESVSGIDFTNVTTANNMFIRCSSLENISNTTQISCSLYLGDSPLLSVEDAVNSILRNLVDLTGKASQKITFDTALQSSISESEIQAATDKNWVISFS